MNIDLSSPALKLCRVINNAQFGFEVLKTTRTQPLSEYINCLICGIHKLNAQVFSGNLLPDKMHIDLNVLSAAMKHRITG